MASPSGARPKFGDAYLNTQASESNPRRVSMFVRIVRRSGRLNPGVWWQMTNGDGDFWLSNPAHLNSVSATLMGNGSALRNDAPLPDQSTDRPLDVPAVAARLGLTLSTVHTYRSLDQRDNGHRLPAPDGYVSGQPWWWPETIDAFKPSPVA